MSNRFIKIIVVVNDIPCLIVYKNTKIQKYSSSNKKLVSQINTDRTGVSKTKRYLIKFYIYSFRWVDSYCRR